VDAAAEEFSKGTPSLKKHLRGLLEKALCVVFVDVLQIKRGEGDCENLPAGEECLKSCHQRQLREKTKMHRNAGRRVVKTGIRGPLLYEVICSGGVKVRFPGRLCRVGPDAQ